MTCGYFSFAQAADNVDELERLSNMLNRIERNLDRGNIPKAQRVLSRAQGVVYDLLDDSYGGSTWNCSMSNKDFGGLLTGKGDTEQKARNKLYLKCINQTKVTPGVCDYWAQNPSLAKCVEL